MEKGLLIQKKALITEKALSFVRNERLFLLKFGYVQ